MSTVEMLATLTRLGGTDAYSNMEKIVFHPLICKATNSKVLFSSNIVIPESQAFFLIQLLKAGLFSI